MRRRVRFLSVLAAGLLAAPLFAADPGLTAEATETVRLAPDTVKVYLTIETKDGDSTAATEANVKLKKDLTDALDKLAIKGMDVKATQKVVSRESSRANGLGGGGGGIGGIGQPPPVDTVNISTPVVLTLTDAQPDRLVESVEKVLQAAAGLGISGANAADSRLGYNPFSVVTSGRARVAYSVKGGWDGPTDAALAKATARAKAKAAALAKGAAVELGGLLSVQEVPEAPAAAETAYSPFSGLTAAQPHAADEVPLVDGELVRTVRVRVTYAVK